MAVLRRVAFPKEQCDKAERLPRGTVVCGKSFIAVVRPCALLFGRLDFFTATRMMKTEFWATAQVIARNHGRGDSKYASDDRYSFESAGPQNF
jgi:hypothetical protein